MSLVSTDEEAKLTITEDVIADYARGLGKYLRDDQLNLLKGFKRDHGTYFPGNRYAMFFALQDDIKAFLFGFAVGKGWGRTWYFTNADITYVIEVLFAIKSEEE
jgi:hypothetical protein